jgi:hypothetical protein
MTNEQLNAAAAKYMGWEKRLLPVATWADGAYACWHDTAGPTVSVSAWLPVSNLTQAWEFARAKDLWNWEMDRDWARVWMAPNRAFSEPHDGTPQDAARALTVCVLRANGVEV